MSLLRIVKQFGTPVFVYDLARIDAQLTLIHSAFGGRFRVSYAMKSNPNPAILAEMLQRVPYLDVSSGGELKKGLAAGWPSPVISFTGPAKTRDQLQLAIVSQVGEIVVESLEEAKEISEIAQERGVLQPILARLAPAKLPPGFGVKMAGKPSQFGLDEEDLEELLPRIAELPAVVLDGFHIYSGTQSLKVGAIAENYRIYLDLFRFACELLNMSPKKLVFGSGLGIPYHDGDQPLDLSALAEDINPELDGFRSEARYRSTEFILETGRFVVGESGTYITRVVRVKESRGTPIAICDGGMNHHLGACGHLGTVIHRNYQMFVVDKEDLPASRPFDLVGPLCTTIDTLGHRVNLPDIQSGDCIGVRASGAYGLTASPLNFISHDPPREVLIDSRCPNRDPVEIGVLQPKAI